MTRKPGSTRVSRLPVIARHDRGPVSHEVPPGKLEMVVTFLQMTRPPVRPPAPHRGEKLALMRAEMPTVSFYRYLYNTVGARWLWYERRLLDEAGLLAVVHDPKVEIYVLYAGGVPAGFAELDLRMHDVVELALFGLMPEFIGRGLGRYFLDWAVDKAWDKRPERVWVHTSNLDHPAAVAMYQRAGFVPYRQELEIVADPRCPGAMPEGQEFAPDPMG